MATFDGFPAFVIALYFAFLSGLKRIAAMRGHKERIAQELAASLDEKALPRHWPD